MLFRSHDLPEDWELKIPGDHNRYAAALATEATRALGIADEDIRQALGAFTGVQGRLEKIADIQGVSVYNDTTATTPNATIAALQALDPKNTQNIVLIMGGADKGLEMSPLLLEIPKHIKKLIFLSGTGTSRIYPLLSDAPVYDTLKGAVDEAFKHAEAGDTVLLSPAFASFGMFKNEYDRGDQFNAIVAGL